MGASVNWPVMCLGLVVSVVLFVRCGPTTMQFPESINTPESEYARAIHLLESGTLDKAETVLRRAIQLDGNYAPAYVGMSRLFFARGDELKAIRYVHMARIRDVDYVPCWLMAGRLYAAAGQYEAAVNEYREAISRDEKQLWAVESYFGLARTLEKLNKLEKAHGAYMEIIALDPFHLEAREAVARILKMLGPPFLMRLRFEKRDILLP